MKLLLVKLILLLGLMRQGRAQLPQYNLTSYRKMPDLYEGEDYDQCLQQPLNTFCMVYAEIVPNASAPLWPLIEEISQDSKHNYRHDKIFLGVCLNQCRQELSALNNSQIEELYEDAKMMDTVLSAYIGRVHKRDSDERQRYDKLVNSCLNRRFKEKYQLRLRSTIESCQRADETLAHDWLDLTVYWLSGLLLLLTVASTIYDYRLKRQQPLSVQSNLHYKKNLGTNKQRLLSAFSLCRNYYRLVVPHISELSQDLLFFDAFRTFGVFAVILGHTAMIFVITPAKNPEYFEQMLHKGETAIMQNGHTVIQIFFVITGFLLYVNFTQRKLVSPSSSIWECVVVYFRVFLVRYFRLVPSLIALILFNGTVLTRMQDGPFWRHLVEGERIFCREQWWKNMLFINNYLYLDSCAPQTWYLGADMQLFELFLIILIITTKHPKLKRAFDIGMAFLVFAVPALVTYFLKLDAIYHMQLENVRYLFFRNTEVFYEAYLPFYTNMGGYVLGFLCGEFYLKVRAAGRADSYQGKLKYELSFWLVVPTVLLVLFSGYIFMKYDIEKPSLWLALYAGLYRILWVLICAGIVCFMCFKVGWMAYELCRLPFFRPLSRISFQAFLWHGFTLRLMAGYHREPIYLNNLFMFSQVILIFIFTQIVAFFAALLIEYPMVEVMNYCYKKDDTIKKSAPPTTENSVELTKV